MSAELDRRRNAFRPDLADARLRRHVAAERYVDGEPREVIWPAAPLRARPDPKASFATEALFGERVLLFEDLNGWSWVQLEGDSYVGYLPTAALALPVSATTHRVKALGTFVYPVADMKSPPLMHLSINAQLRVAETADQFVRLERGGFVFGRHVAPVGRHPRDFVDIAERLQGTPYLWGGRTRLGTDCSGLVQIGLEAAGVACPRDSDMQFAELGSRVEVTPELEGLQRGDLVFWRGHVGIMCDGLMLLHANAHHMATAIETLPEAANRIRKSGSEIVGIRRLRALSA